MALRTLHRRHRHARVEEQIHLADALLAAKHAVVFLRDVRELFAVVRRAGGDTKQAGASEATHKHDTVAIRRRCTPQAAHLLNRSHMALSDSSSGRGSCATIALLVNDADVTIEFFCLAEQQTEQ
jgi:hypothetical protein